jgi:beta-glucosidase
MHELLMRIHSDYPGVPLVITENGAAFDDHVTGEGAARTVADRARIDYLRSHIGEVLHAIHDGADVRGYFVWSLLDNFEWGFGYSKRFGIVHVDYKTQQRTLKDSAHWNAAVVAANGLQT